MRQTGCCEHSCPVATGTADCGKVSLQRHEVFRMLPTLTSFSVREDVAVAKKKAAKKAAPKKAAKKATKKASKKAPATKKA